MSDLNIVHAASLARVGDSGEPRRGVTQGDLGIITDGAVAIRDGVIVAVGPTDEVLASHGDDVATIDATGRCVLPGLVECHSHPLFAGERHHEYAERLAGASLAEVAARGGGIWSSVIATRQATDDDLLSRLAVALRRIMAGGVTTLEVKSGYGLTVEQELRQLDLLRRARSLTPMQLAITFLGAHVVPRDLDGDIDRASEDRAERYTDLIDAEMLPAVVAQGVAEFQDVTVEQGYFTPEQGLRLMHRSREAGLPVRVHADAWATSQGWRTAVAGGAVSAEHLTYTPIEEIREVGRTDTIAVILPIAELIYMTSRRADARAFIEHEVPVAVATDYCSSIHATSLLNTVATAAPWFRMTPGEVVVGATLNAAYSLGLQASCGSLDPGKRGDVLILDCEHPDEVCLAVGAPLIDSLVIGGEVTVGATSRVGRE
ncbi:MAG: imidazolonepropionase [Ilumatobacteraceae bacterium]|nr:imidazolonepropionase [Ilumatobacteraceae bacterium]